MCGICGVVPSDGVSVPLNLMNELVEALAHRGPDDSGIWQSKRAALGHTRLSIVDPTARSAQPMLNANASTIISFNGEIYNYKELRKDL